MSPSQDDRVPKVGRWNSIEPDEASIAADRPSCVVRWVPIVPRKEPERRTSCVTQWVPLEFSGAPSLVRHDETLASEQFGPTDSDARRVAARNRTEAAHRNAAAERIPTGDPDEAARNGNY